MLWGESVAYYVNFSYIFHLPVKYHNQRCKNFQILPYTWYCLSGIWSTEETTLKMDPQITDKFGIPVTQHRNSTYLQLHWHDLSWCYSFLYQNQEAINSLIPHVSTACKHKNSMDMMLLTDVTKFSQKINYVFLVLNREFLAGFNWN